MGTFGHIVTTFKTLAHEAEADEHRISREIGRHRRVQTKAEVMQEKAHRTAKHCVHIVILTGAGLPAILAFEAARPLWTKYVETPLSDIMIGDHGETVTHATEMLRTALSAYLHY